MVFGDKTVATISSIIMGSSLKALIFLQKLHVNADILKVGRCSRHIARLLHILIDLIFYVSQNHSMGSFPSQVGSTFV